MKRILQFAAAVLCAALFFTGCAAARTEQVEGDGRLSVYASFYTMYDFAQKIGGEKARITVMVPDGTEPHDWEPAAADIAGLQNADLFIYNGAGMEHWAEDILASLGASAPVAVEASEGIALREGAHGDEGEGAEEEEEHAGMDPHVWLDPNNAKKELENIKNAFVQADPDNASYYEANYETWAKELDDLDGAFRAGLSSLPRKEIIVAHEAYGYLCEAYGLTQIGIEGLAPDSEPDPGRMAEIIGLAREKGVTTIFFEELSSPDVANAIAAETGAKTAVLSPVEGLTDEERAAGADYLSVMRKNLDALKEALQ
ncbi:MAG TPA: metal ABC transporter substrate-binding protein [Feifaniaceae bacterium]|nr:metal ABC transporter substrate-binding protein [Feifaniaceae bacterium]